MSAPDTNYLSGTAKPGPYRTKLSLLEEADFQHWLQAHKVPFDDSDHSDYDMRGFWKEAQKGGNANVGVGTDGLMHFTDKYKTPYHKSFSRESIYATPNAPKWVGNKLIDKLGTVLVDEDQ